MFGNINSPLLENKREKPRGPLPALRRWGGKENWGAAGFFMGDPCTFPLALQLARTHSSKLGIPDKHSHLRD